RMVIGFFENNRFEENNLTSIWPSVVKEKLLQQIEKMNADIFRLRIRYLDKRLVGSDFRLPSRVSAHNASAPNIYRD
ncbi:hypothetical protein KJ965_05355, partial [Patescibacteria group bacterium]|nr:hypothetical protein [Patescibacteria group bacterium]